MHPADPLSIFLWNLGYAMCHQLPERSFFYGGYQMPVCARDMGIYLGFLVVFAYWMIGRRYRNGDRPDVVVFTAVMIGVLAFAVDALSSYAGLRETTNTLRLISGLLMGAAIGFLLLSALSAMQEGDRKNRSFSWKDLPIIYLAILLIFLVSSYALGTGMYYVMESVTMMALLVLLMTAVLVMVSALTAKKLSDRREAYKMLAISGIATTILLIVLWYMHHLLGPLLPPGTLG